MAHTIIRICAPVLLCLNLAIAASYTVSAVPNPKTAYGGSVSDPDNLLTADVKDGINRLIDAIEDSTTAQVAVVIVNSIGEADPKEFATELFNAWGIGRRGADNGLLILCVIDQRAWEMETGYGTEGVLTDALCKVIGEKHLVPWFRKGEYGRGLAETVAQVKVILEGGADESLVSRRIILASGEQRRQGSVFWSAVASVLAVLSVVWVLVAVNAIRSIQRKNPDPYQQYRKLNSSAWVLIGLAVFGLISLPFVIWIVRHYRGRFRRMPRTSVKNGKPMRLLDEEQDDAFLNAGQLCEETIRSVDYDVWVTEERDDIMVLRYDRWSGKYKACNSCSYRTEYKSSSHVITPATYSSSGLAEDRFTCMHCGHTRTATHVIPRKRRSSSSSGSSHGSSGSRSFGGGRSGGGGAGGKW